LVKNKNYKNKKHKNYKHKIINKLTKNLPIHPIKSRGGGGIHKPPKNEQYRIISRTDIEGPLEYMKWHGVNLAHCHCKRTDKIIKIDPETGEEIPDIIITEGHKCKTINCKYPHLYSQKCHWKRHALTEHCNRKFSCIHCGATFRQQTQRKEHVINKHTAEMNKWRCPYGCNGVFSQFRGVVRHVKFDRKCPARTKYFNMKQTQKLKKKWDNDKMKKMLKFTTNITVKEDHMVTLKMQEETRRITKELLKEYESE